MASDPAQRKNMLIAGGALVAILVVGGFLAWYYELLPGSGPKQVQAVDPMQDPKLPEEMKKEAAKQQAAHEAEIKKKPKAGS